MSNESNLTPADVQYQSHETIVDLVKEAKHRPLPKSTKALFVVLAFALVFTGGIAYGKQKATQTGGAGLSLTGLGASSFGAGGFGTGRIRNGGAPSGASSGASSSGAAGAFAGGSGTTTAVSADVAGTVVSIDAKSVVVTTLSGGNETFPITDTTRVRVSSKLDLSGIKAGDVVTIKPDDANAAKTITVVK